MKNLLNKLYEKRYTVAVVGMVLFSLYHYNKTYGDELDIKQKALDCMKSPKYHNVFVLPSEIIGLKQLVQIYDKDGDGKPDCGIVNQIIDEERKIYNKIPMEYWYDLNKDNKSQENEKVLNLESMI